ncbi:M20/M25/M40 family metallo-hydrolase [Albimonas pacifica]|uniref:Succinyl-diaminopimelate desuccinylase n=1 Tax=Albimonas pacifica TaxID=1114924 RepID=A0A1I3CJY9_9RHOB|nr:M20/M25/M40 family metallo-hydrolase [Albimonas pacifica]SFH74643.1 succinyl-diaminopimelate desuccinylase [Albimonas pacifica]
MSVPDPRPDPRDGAATRAWMAARAEGMAARTAELVRIDSQTPPSATRPMAEACAALLADLPGAEIAFHEAVAPVTNLMVAIPGARPGRRLVLNGHLDTYPVGDAARWTRAALGGEIADGLLYGRGSADMKGGLVAMIEAARLLAARPFAGEIVLAFGGDEERMGELGTQAMIDDLPRVRGDGVIVADAGGPRAVRLGEKGMLWLELSAQGRSAHGAHVHAGDNAADRLLDALTALRGLEASALQEPAEAARLMDEAAAHAGADGPEPRRTMRRLTVNLGRIEAGISANLVPDAARAACDVRIPVGLSTAEVEAEARRLLAPFGVEMEIVRRYEPTWTPAGSPIARACLAGTAAALGEAWHDGRIGGSDARLWRRAGFETVAMGLTPRNLGGPDEALEIAELAELAAAIAASGARFLEG